MTMGIIGRGKHGFFENPKVVFGFILVLVVCALGLGAYRFANGIRGGFVPIEEQLTIAGNGNENEQPPNEALRTKDTDADGLSDYDELYLYKTSPYLKDTDSDGLGDTKELDAGTDPNCPEGKSCKQVVPEGAPPSVLDNPLFEGIAEEAANSADLFGEEPVETNSAVGTPDGPKNVSLDTSNKTNTSDTLDVQNLTAPQIRQLLLESGKITKAQLDQIDDKTLMRVFAEVVQNSQ